MKQTRILSFGKYKGARSKRKKYDGENNRPYISYHILVDGDEKFGGKTYRTE